MPVRPLRLAAATFLAVVTSSIAGCRACQTVSGQCMDNLRYCDGDVYVFCATSGKAAVFGKVQRIDCAADGQKCFDTGQAVSCAPHAPDCDQQAFVPRCEGNAQIVCAQFGDYSGPGVTQKVACAAPNAVCVKTSENAVCVRDATPCDPKTFVLDCKNDDGDVCAAMDDKAYLVRDSYRHREACHPNDAGGVSDPL
jgi:hypothetical protein